MIHVSLDYANQEYKDMCSFAAKATHGHFDGF